MRCLGNLANLVPDQPGERREASRGYDHERAIIRWFRATVAWIK
jgi:hypothetical protein